jgi:hypothetical protein
VISWFQSLLSKWVNVCRYLAALNTIDAPEYGMETQYESGGAGFYMVRSAGGGRYSCVLHSCVLHSVCFVQLCIKSVFTPH